MIDFAKDVAGSAKLGLRMTMTIIPIAGLFLAITLFRRKFILTDEKVQELAEEIAKKRESEA